MEETGGFFEEMNSEDCEEVELSAVEEEFENIEEFKESAVSNEIEGVLREAGVEENIIEDKEEEQEQITSSGDIRVIYVNKSSVQNSEASVSGNQIVILDSSQFEFLIDEISSLKQETIQSQTVSMNDYTESLQELHNIAQGSLLVNAMMFALCFGYFVKETIFRGV